MKMYTLCWDNNRLLKHGVLGVYTSKRRAIKALKEYIDKLIGDDLWIEFSDYEIGTWHSWIDLGFRIEIVDLNRQAIYSTEDETEYYDKLNAWLNPFGKIEDLQKVSD